MDIKPINDRVLISRLEEERTSAGGIVIPDSAAEKPSQGIIEAVGPGRKKDNGDLIPIEVKKGQKVLFGKYAGTEFEFHGKKYLIMREEDIFAIVGN